jgi:hypothetical protein
LSRFVTCATSVVSKTHNYVRDSAIAPSIEALYAAASRDGPRSSNRSDAVIDLVDALELPSSGRCKAAVDG